MRRSLAQRLLLLASPVGAVLFIGTFLIDGALQPAYDGARQTISDLELVGPGWVQQSNFIVFGLLIGCFAIGMRRELVRGPVATWFPLLQGVVALGLVGSGIFIHDPTHTIASLFALVPAVIGFLVIAGRFAGDPRWRGWMAYSIVSALLMMAFLAAFGTALGQGGSAGLFEKLAVVVRSVWSILFVGRLLNGTAVSPRRVSN